MSSDRHFINQSVITSRTTFVSSEFIDKKRGANFKNQDVASTPHPPTPGIGAPEKSVDMDNRR